MVVVCQADPRGLAPVPRLRTGEGQTILALQSGLAATAVRRKGYSFKRLYPWIWRREWLGKALDAVLDNSGSETPGVDGKRGSWLRDPSARASFIGDLSRELRQRYKVSPVLRKYVPKAGGAQRPIGIPTIRDRVVQMALKMVLEPIFEADFLPNSNGFRTGRSTLECVLPLYQYGNATHGYGWVIEGDIKGCFDNINHRVLMNAVRRRIADRRILRLIWRFLKAPVVERGVRTKTRKGTPQGGVLSPLLANVYLNEFDQYWLEHWGKLTESKRKYWRKRGKASCVLLRYADDFILTCKGERRGVADIVNEIRSFFADQLKLELTPEKTKVVSLDDGFEFLGFRIQRWRLGHYGRCVRIYPTRRGVARLKVKLHRMLGLRANADSQTLKIRDVNRVLRGWSNYYCKVNSEQQFLAVDYLVDKQVVSWLVRKQRITVREGFRQLRKETVFRLSSLSSQRISRNLRACWKYRSIPNPCLRKGYETSIDDGELPLVDAREVHPIDALYDEIYQINRLKAFDRDGWRCVDCGERVGLIAHHVQRVPRGKVFDPALVHRVENLKTLCARCHRKYRHSV